MHTCYFIVRIADITDTLLMNSHQKSLVNARRNKALIYKKAILSYDRDSVPSELIKLGYEPVENIFIELEKDSWRE